MRIVKPNDVVPAPSPLKTYYIQRYDDKTFTVIARHYYRTDTSYIFTMSSAEEVHKSYMSGRPYLITPLLEIDVDGVLLVADQSALEIEEPLPKRRTKKTVDNSKVSR